MKILKLILLTIFIPLGWAYSQPDNMPFKPVWNVAGQDTFIIPKTLFWSLDSTSLYFNVEYFGVNQLERYSIINRALSSAEALPRTIDFSSEQQEHFHARFPFGYIAPDGDTFIYASTDTAYFSFEGGSEAYLYAFGNLGSLTYVPTRLDSTSSSDDRFRWSDDSSTLVVEHSSPYGGIEALTYIKNRKSNCWCSLGEIGLPMQLDTGESIYDISPDGERILYPAPRNILGYWDVKRDAVFGEIQNAGTYLPLEGVIGAAFLPDKPDEILAITQVGLIRYDLTHRQSVVIDSQINSKWANWAMFSPDNQWVAVLAGGSYGRKQLSVLPVAR